MAEFLIYDQDNWMDVPSKDRPDLTGYKNVERKTLKNSKLTIEQRTKNLFINDSLFSSKDRRGDIIEAKQDNAPRGWLEEASFTFVRVQGLSLKDAKQYAIPDVDKSDPAYPILIHKRKYFIDMTGLTLDLHKNVSLTINQFNSRLKEKTK